MEVKIAKAFGRVLREARLKAEFSQERLALDAGVDRTFVSMLERGKRQPTLETLFSLASVLNIAPSTLIARTTAELG
jgi:transcriptional regulator with XRE-family HTH domain